MPLPTFLPTSPPDDPPLRIGDRCVLTFGGTTMTVVDCDADYVVVSWRFRGNLLKGKAARSDVRRISGAGL